MTDAQTNYTFTPISIRTPRAGRAVVSFNVAQGEDQIGDDTQVRIIWDRASVPAHDNPDFSLNETTWVCLLNEFKADPAQAEALVKLAGEDLLALVSSAAAGVKVSEQTVEVTGPAWA